MLFTCNATIVTLPQVCSFNTSIFNSTIIKVDVDVLTSFVTDGNGLFKNSTKCRSIVFW